MNRKRADLLPAPRIVEAEPSKVPGMEIIIVENLGPEGATLIVEYPTMAGGHSVRVWENTPGYVFDVTQILPEGAKPLTFNVPKSILNNMETTLTYQYALLDEKGDYLAVSYMKTYLKQAVIPSRLPAPFIKEAQPLDDTREIIIVDNLGSEGATLVIKYPEIAEGDRIKCWINIDGSYDARHTVRKSETEVKLKIPLEKLENTAITLTASYMIVDENDNIIRMSDNKLYFKKPGFEGFPA